MYQEMATPMSSPVSGSHVDRGQQIYQVLTPVQVQSFMLLVGPMFAQHATMGVSCDQIDCGPCAPLVAMGVFVQRDRTYLLTPLGYWVYAVCVLQAAAKKAPLPAMR